MAHSVTGCQSPVFEKHILQMIHCIPFNTKMRISPIAHLGVFSQIIITYIHSPGEARQPVNHEYLAVIAVIEAAVQQRSKRRQKK